jgi:hypothetical protein
VTDQASFAVTLPDGTTSYRESNTHTYTHVVALWTPAGGAGWGIVSWHTDEHAAFDDFHRLRRKDKDPRIIPVSHGR